MARVSGVDATHIFNVPVIYYTETDPGFDIDTERGYNPGDEWRNTATGAYFKCIANDAGAAVWLPVGVMEGGITEAPLDGKTYARERAAWVETLPLVDAASIAYVDDGDAALKQQVDEADDALQAEKLNVLGVIDGSEAPPGAIGEYKVEVNTVGAQLASDTTTQICQINLGPGDWEIWGACGFTPPGNVSPNMICAGVSVHPDALPDENDLLYGVGILNQFTTTALTSGQRQVLMTGTCRSNSAEPIDLYLVAQTSFTSGAATVTTKGYICARRVR